MELAQGALRSPRLPPRWPKSKPGGGCDRATAHPRPHGWLGEIMSVIGPLLVGIIIIAALAAAVAWLFGFI